LKPKPKNINELREMTKENKERVKKEILIIYRSTIEEKILNSMCEGRFSIKKDFYYNSDYDLEKNKYIIDKNSVEFEDECARQIASELIEYGFKVETIKRETMISLDIDWSNESKEIKEFKSIFGLGE
jgi:hypothetical protein